MRVHLCVVGRLRKGPEKDLIDDYLDRFNKAGRAFGLGPAKVIEVADKKNGGMLNEAHLLRRAIPKGAFVVIMDERGSVVSSPDFSAKIRTLADKGTSDLAIVIGGAEGIDPSLRAESDFSISFGKMVWPHALVRVMLAEQLYRGASILAKSPYHRI